MNDWVASYLIKENFLLTALEFYQELKESGKEQHLLSKLFKHREYNEENFVQKQKDMDDPGLPPNMLAGNEQTRVLQNQLQKKDERINVLQYEIRILKSDIEKLKQQLSEALKKAPSQKAKNRDLSNGGSASSVGIPNVEKGANSLTEFLGSDHAKEFAQSQSVTNAHHSQSNENLRQMDNEDNSDAVLKPSNLQPIQNQEKQVINYMIRQFLLDNDYKISAISFTDEVNDKDMVNMDDIWNNMNNADNSGQNDQDLNLLYLYRYYYKDNDQSKQRMKDAKALREALLSIEQKNKMLKTYEQSMLSQEKTIDKLMNENNELKKQISILKGETSITVAPEAKKLEGVRLLPSESSNTKVTAKEVPTESIREVSVLQAKLKDYEDKDKSLIHLLGQKLPGLVRSMKSTKREELIPIIIAALQAHPEFEVRNKLSSLLFNVIKKPDVNQREMLIDSYASLVRKISPEQFENELLPHCWEQIDSKYPERRILMTDVCGHLASYISSSLRASLLLSMMSQLISDRIDEVRLGVATNLSLLVQSFDSNEEHSSKYSQVEEMMIQLLFDRSFNVAKVAQETLAPAIAKWANTFGSVFDKFLNTLFIQMEAIVPKKLDKGDRDTEKLLLLIETVKGLIPLLYNITLDSMPKELDIQVPNMNNSTKKEQFDYFWSNYDANRDKAIIEKWNAIRWIATNGLERMISIIVSIDVNLKPVADQCYSFLHDLCLKFGRKFTYKIIQPQVLSVLQSQDNAYLNKLMHNKSQPAANLAYVVKERLLPAYITGILAICEPNDISEFIRELIVGIGLGERGWNNSHVPILHNSICMGCKIGGDLTEQLLSVLWNLCMHPSKSVREVVVNLFNVLMDVLDANTISTRVMKALVALSADPERTIRLAAINGLGKLATNITAPADFDKLSVQFDNFFSNRDPEIKHEALKIFSHIIPQVEAYFRDHYILQKLTKIGTENNLNPDQEDRKKTALLLFDCYRALNGCVLTRDTVSKYIISALEMLEKDAELLGDSMHKTISDMIRDLKRGIDPNYIPPSDKKTTTAPAADSNPSKIKNFFNFRSGGKNN